MSLRDRLRALRALLDRSPKGEVEEELRFHLEERARDYRARGLDDEAARLAAAKRFGDVEGVRELCVRLVAGERRARRRHAWVDDLLRDARLGVRSAVRAPLFTTAAVSILALGTGANAAVFGVVKSALLDALPYRDASRVVRLVAARMDGSDAGAPLSAATVAALGTRSLALRGIGAFFPSTYDIVHGSADGPRVLRATLAEPAFFRTLGVEAAVGRIFTQEEVDIYAPVVLLDWTTWRSAFSGDPSVVGSTIRLDNQPVVVVGVLPSGFVGPAGRADVWRGLRLGAFLGDARAHDTRQLGAVARLRPGTTTAAADEDVAAIAAQLAADDPDMDGGWTARAVPIRRAMVGDARLPLLLMLASAGLVLVVACANLAGAMLSRTVSRRREMAARVALGAGRGRLVRQLLTESAVLSLTGVAAGVVVAILALAAAGRFATDLLPSWVDLRLDVGVLGVMALVGIVVAAAIGVAPALAASRTDVQRVLRTAGGTAGEGAAARRLRGALVSGQIALSLGLLAGAGLLARSLWTMGSTPLGYDPGGVLTVSMKGPVPATDADRRRFFEELLHGVRTLPGVASVATTNALPGAEKPRERLVPADRTDGESPPAVALRTVSDDYFDALRIPLLEGRTFDDRDGRDDPRAVVLGESLARRWWPGGGALGARVRVGPDDDAPWRVVVGVVGDVRNDPTAPSAEPTAYGSDRQDPLRSSRVYVVRTERDPTTLVEPFRRALAAVDPGVPMTDVGTLRGDLDRSLDGRKLPALLLGGFALLTLLLASMGVYALFSNMVQASETELAVRLALGATPGRIASLVVSRGALWLALGLGVGAVGVMIAGRALRSLLFEVSPLDPVALLVAVGTLLLSAGLALLAPIRRTTRTAVHNVVR